MQAINEKLIKDKDKALRQEQEAQARCSTLEAQLRDVQEEKGVLFEQVDIMCTSCLGCIVKPVSWAALSMFAVIASWQNIHTIVIGIVKSAADIAA